MKTGLANLARVVLFTTLAICYGCDSDTGPEENGKVHFPDNGPFDLLSSYQLFSGNLSDLSPNDHVIPYDLNMPLFSDYAEKKRFVYLPEGTAMTYNEGEIFEFPNQTILIKNFFYDINGMKSLIETRLLIGTDSGWQAFAYQWNEEQTDARLINGGALIQLSSPHQPAEQFYYKIPNNNQCKGCHERNSQLVPIGLKSRNLNIIVENSSENQLINWAKFGFLKGLPDSKSLEEPFPDMSDFQSPLNMRARAYLDVNCGHCHHPNGPANNSGLFLHFEQEENSNLGICKTPVSVGPGTGGHSLVIKPGQADESILTFRMISVKPEIRMPELGRALVHEEGLELITEWINSLPENNCN